MGKKNKDDAPNVASVANRDILQRLNFLYQASVLLNGLAPPGFIHDNDGAITANDKDTSTEQSGPATRPKEFKKKESRRVVGLGELSRSYVATMKSVGQKTNVRMDPSVKRRICKRCNTPLVPGISATVRVKDSASHSHLISYQCHGCQTERRIPAPPILRVDPPANEERIQPAEASTSSTPAATTDIEHSLLPARRKRKGPRPRPPPHFARDAGHVVFRGNERLDMARGIS